MGIKIPIEEKIIWTTGEAANMMGVDPNFVRQLCNSGEVPSWSRGREIKITASVLKETLEKFAKEGKKF